MMIKTTLNFVAILAHVTAVRVSNLIKFSRSHPASTTRSTFDEHSSDLGSIKRSMTVVTL